MTLGDANAASADLGSDVERLPGNILQLDTRTAGVSKVTAGYLIPAPRPTLIECGPALSIDAVIDALTTLGLDPDDLTYLVVSHIHLDHAGGAGDIARAFGSTKIVVSEIGARHLVDPQRLNASSRRVYGPLMDTIYGECTPIAQDRILGIGERDQLDLGGGRTLELLATPGHAKHHMSMVDSDTGALFVGDSVGVKTPNTGPLRPATPPPDFDLDQALHTLARYRELDPSRVYLAHYGAIDPPADALDEAAERLRAWADVARTAVLEHNELDHVADTLAARFDTDVAIDDTDPDAHRRVEILGSYRSNAMGLLRYWGKRLDGAPSASDEG